MQDATVPKGFLKESKKDKYMLFVKKTSGHELEIKQEIFCKFSHTITYTILERNYG